MVSSFYSVKSDLSDPRYKKMPTKYMSLLVKVKIEGIVFRAEVNLLSSCMPFGSIA